jgi:protein-disulfide isomerase
VKSPIFVKVLLLAAASFCSFTAFAADKDSTFSQSQQNQIQDIVRNYILKNPQVLVQSMQNMQKQAHAEMVKQAQQVIDKEASALFNAPNTPVIGNPKGNITLVEFFDYQCPYCKRVSPGINQLIKDNANLRVVYKELPIFGDSSMFAAQAALASQTQNKYLAFHNALMAAKPPFTSDQVLTIAKSVGIDVDKLQNDMKSEAVMSEIKNNIALANEMQLVGTPAFVVATVKIDGKQVAKPAKSMFIPGAVSADNLEQIIKQMQ